LDFFAFLALLQLAMPPLWGYPVRFHCAASVSADVLFLRMFFIRSFGVLAFINAAKQVWAVSGNASEDAYTQTGCG